MQKPNNIPQTYLNEIIIKILDESSYTQFKNEIRGNIMDVARGVAFKNKIVVPYWAYKPHHPKNIKTNGGYFIYYVAHELAHIIAYKKFGVACGHDSNFYAVFLEICPKEYQHFELEYKKTEAY